MKLSYLPVFMLFAMCNPTENTSGPANSGQVITERLTVVDRTGLDGCGFLLQRSDSSLLEPVNLPVEFLQEQIVVDVSYREISDRMSICMAGKIIEITEVKLAKK